MTRQVALITGASSGIGYELVKLFARDGYDLVLTARNCEQLGLAAAEARTAGAKVELVVADLAEAGAPQMIFDELQRRGIHVDVLVNNAGFGVFGLFSHSTVASQLGMVQVNVAALTQLTRLFLPEMLAAGEGRILNVASMAAYAPGPFLAVYYASKAYVLSFSEALAEELRGTGVRVTVVCPGPTKTDFQRRAGAKETALFRGHNMDAAEVARLGYEGFRQGNVVVITGWRNKLTAIAAKFAPRKLIRWVTRKRNEKR